MKLNKKIYSLSLIFLLLSQNYILFVSSIKTNVKSRSLLKVKNRFKNEPDPILKEFVETINDIILNTKKIKEGSTKLMDKSIDSYLEKKKILTKKEENKVKNVIYQDCIFYNSIKFKSHQNYKI